MIIKCQSCYARYSLKNCSIGSEGRNVKCCKCGYVWFVDPRKKRKTPVKSSSSSRVADFSQKNNNTNEPTLLSERTQIYCIYSSVVVVCCIFCSLGIFFFYEMPEGFKRGFYGSALCKVFNMNDTSGIVMNDLRLVYNSFDSNIITVRGTILNDSHGHKLMPFIKITLESNDGKILAHYSVKSNGKIINPHASENFSYQLINFPGDTDKVVVDVGSKLDIMLR